MAFDPVPLAIGEGALHSDNVWRVAANIFSRDAAGVRKPGDFKVTATPTPSGTVTIAPGGMVLPNVQAPGESYVGRAPTPTDESRSLTTAGSHLIIARIIDPEFDPWQPSGTPGAPNTDVATGPYFQPHVIPGVSNTTTLAEEVVAYTAEALARIDNPTGLGAIDPTMIKDLRRLAQPRIGFTSDVQSGPDPAEFVTLTETTFHDWPSTNSLRTRVPRWATHAQVIASLNSIKANAAADVDVRVVMAGMVGPTAFFDYNGNPGTGVGYVETTNLFVYGEFDVRHLQGQTVTVRTQAMRTFVTNTGDVWMDNRQQVMFDVRYTERVV